MKVIVPIEKALKIIRKHYKLPKGTQVLIECEDEQNEPQRVSDPPMKSEEKLTGNFVVGFK